MPTSEIIRLREGSYTAGQIDTRWSHEIERDFSQWLRNNSDELPAPREQIEEILKQRRWLREPPGWKMRQNGRGVSARAGVISVSGGRHRYRVHSTSEAALSGT